MFKKPQVPKELREKFDALRASKVVLSRNTPLMPAIKTGGFWRTLRLMMKITVLPAGTELILQDVAMRDARAWYSVQVKGSFIYGWINSINFEGKGIV